MARRRRWVEKHGGRNVYCTSVKGRPSFRVGDVLIHCAAGTGGKFYSADLVTAAPRESDDPRWTYETECRAKPLAMVGLGAAPNISELRVDRCPRTYAQLTDEQGKTALGMLEDLEERSRRARAEVQA